MSAESPFKHPWWYPYTEQGNSARYLDEWIIFALSDTIRRKPDWERKYKDPEIVKKWRSEFLDQKPETKHPEEIFDYVMAELKWYDELQSQPELKEKKFLLGPDDKILFSDFAVDEKTAERFFELAAKFEASIPEKDYHPGSGDLVVDLVHPSLFHLVYGQTRFWRDGKVEIAEYSEEISKVKKHVSDWGVSKNFQWLPAIMKLENDKKTFEFASYINNLHPVKNKDLYGSIASVFNSVLPGLNMCLSRYQSEEYMRIKTADWGEIFNDEYAEFERKLEKLADDWYDGKITEEEYEEEEKKKKNYYREVKPKWEKDPEMKAFDLRDFDNLKVVVKMANIELTPEKPEYKGGSWHVEGTINEDIIATVLYYYDMENIDDSCLSFKYAFEDPRYDQNDGDYCKEFFGIHDEDPMTRYLGNVQAQKNRVIIFPNTFQHHVDSFKLKDASKPGFRKILCFFLVDPFNKVVKATDVVPPQNKAWIEDKELLEKYFPGLEAKDVVSMTEEEAKEKRKALMKERTIEVTENGDFDNAFTRRFSLCEH